MTGVSLKSWLKATYGNDKVGAIVMKIVMQFVILHKRSFSKFSVLLFLEGEGAGRSEGTFDFESFHNNPLYVCKKESREIEQQFVKRNCRKRSWKSLIKNPRSLKLFTTRPPPHPRPRCFMEDFKHSSVIYYSFSMSSTTFFCKSII